MFVSDAAAPNVETGDGGERYTVQGGSGQGRAGGGPGREKQQRGVARTEYSKAILKHRITQTRVAIAYKG